MKNPFKPSAPMNLHDTPEMSSGDLGEMPAKGDLEINHAQTGFKINPNVRNLGIALLATAGIASGNLISSDDSAATKKLNCDENSAQYNTFICGTVSRAKTVKKCVRLARLQPHSFKSRFDQSDSTVKNYTTSFRVENMSGCDPIGDRKMSMVRKVRKGAEGEFESDSKVVTVKTTYGKGIRKVLGKTIKCTPEMSGSAVQTELRTSWVPKTGWPVPKGVNNMIVRSTPPKPIC